MVDVLTWFASLSCILAALLVSLNAGAKWSGVGFLIFSLSSAAWVWASTMQEEAPLALQNIVLLGINLFGVYRYLWQPARSQKSKRMREATS
ncbi:hypothetical protein [Henriciella marina]|jgi:hypothetical protein|uniref:PRC-barrel protein n=1 Tax=Henriciella marina TaxID=453851 RepID=A0ABT4LWL5_9PROT|nr:hypothetical protein [Henriciella marina]MCZ4298538.1 hypothetical protein [Henriciella marina]